NLSRGLGGAMARIAIVSKIIFYSLAIKASASIRSDAWRKRHKRALQTLALIEKKCITLS
ncbi:PIPO, partial [Chilli ringspot virus]|uniref:PIPO n=1 Tax=Chilli ringspot virus TaxID=414528 RepID=UPI0002655028